MSDTKIKYTVPDENTPGYLKRWERRVRYLKVISNPAATADETWKEVMDYLCEYITEPKARKAQEDALVNASKSFINQMVDDIAGEFEADPNS